VLNKRMHFKQWFNRHLFPIGRRFLCLLHFVLVHLLSVIVHLISVMYRIGLLVY